MKLTSEILHRMFLKNGGLMRQDFAQNYDSSLALNTQEMDIYFHALQTSFYRAKLIQNDKFDKTNGAL